TAGLGVVTGQPVTTERLHADERSGDLAVDVQVADLELAAGPVEPLRIPAAYAAGQGVAGAVEQRAGVVEAAGGHDAQPRSESRLTGDSRTLLHVIEDGRLDEPAVFTGPLATEYQAGFMPAAFDVLHDAVQLTFADYGTHVG